MIKKKKKTKKIKKIKFENKKIQRYTTDSKEFYIRWMGPYANSLGHPIIATSLFSIFSYFWLSLVFLDDYSSIPHGGVIATIAVFSFIFLGAINLVFWSNCLFGRCKKCQKIFTSEIISKDFLGRNTYSRLYSVKNASNPRAYEKGEETISSYNDYMRCLFCGYKWQRVSTESYRSK